MSRRNPFTRLDPRDPNFEEPPEVDEEYEAECKLDDMENAERWGME